MKLFATAAAVFVASLTVAASARGAIVITEVHPTGSGSSTYAADWFELTNTGTSAVDLTGWTVDDNSNSFALAVPIRGITSIPAGKTVVFVESGSSGTNDESIRAAFIAAWFGASAPSSFLIAAYGGSGVGLSSGGDAVNVFDTAGNRVANVDFGAATLGVTFDNAAGTSGTISTLSVVGVRGAFTSVTGNEVGSPGLIAATTALQGDYNRDGFVDAADYTVWADRFGQTGTGLPGDGNNDGVVDGADYTIWADNFGRGTPPASSGAIPEPAAASLLALPALALRRRRA